MKDYNIPFKPENILIDGKKIDGTILGIQLTWEPPNKDNPQDHLARRMTVVYQTPQGEQRQFTVGTDSVSIGRERP